MNYVVTKRDNILYSFLKYYAEKECDANYEKRNGQACTECYGRCGDCLKDLACDFGKTIDIPDESL